LETTTVTVMALLEERRHNPIAAAVRENGLYHSFRLPDGTVLPGAMPIEYLEGRLASFNLPLDLNGKRVLDVGPWDGYFTFAMEARGAAVVAIDYVDLDTFRAIHAAFGSQAEYLQLDVYELDAGQHGLFDYVLLLGVLYHLKHPLLALERLCSLTRETCIVETFVVDGDTWLRGEATPIPFIEFYEHDELAGRLDNWSGPTVRAVQAMIRSAGFATADVLHVTARNAIVAASRKWTNLPPNERDPLVLLSVNSHLDRGRTFVSSKEAYLTLWCPWPESNPPELVEVFPEVDGYGIAPLKSAMVPSGLAVHLRLPPGLAPGSHTVRLKVGTYGWSNVERFYVDLPAIGNALRIVSLQDARSWTDDIVYWAGGGWLTIWIEGLSEEADCGNTRVIVDGILHSPDAVVPASGQVNVALRPVIADGLHRLAAEHRDIRSNTVTFNVIGAPPAIRGLENLTSGMA